MQAVIKAAKAAIIVVREVEAPANTTRLAPVMLKAGGPVVRQPTFDWRSLDRYIELCNFEIEVKRFSSLTATTFSKTNFKLL